MIKFFSAKFHNVNFNLIQVKSFIEAPIPLLGGLLLTMNKLGDD